MNLRCTIPKACLLRAGPHLRAGFPLLLLGHAVDWRSESRLTVTGFALLWVFAEASRQLLDQRSGDLQAITSDHLALALGSVQ